MKQRKKVLLATPSYDGKFDVRYVDSLIATIRLCAQSDIDLFPYFLCYDSLVQRARNDYFAVAYENKVDVLFFIDSDIGWNAADFVKLVNSDKDMIGGTYRKKIIDQELYALKVLHENSADNIDIDKDGLTIVQALGCGFLKLSKECYSKLVETEQVSYTNEDKTTKNICECIVTEDNHFRSEDIVLGYKWQKLGGKVYLDTNIKLAHVGSAVFTGDVKMWLESWKTKLETKKDGDQNIASVSPIVDEDMFKVL